MSKEVWLKVEELYDLAVYPAILPDMLQGRTQGEGTVLSRGS